MRPHKHLPFLRVSRLRLIGFVFVREDELPVQASLDCHLAQQGVRRIEIDPAGNLPEEVDFGEEVCLGLEVTEGIQRGKPWLHLNIMSSMYTEKRDEVEDFNFRVLQKQIRTIKRIEVSIGFAIYLYYDQITRQWSRSGVQGPLFLIRTNNTKLVIIFMNQLGKHNESIAIGDHMQFELKKQERDGRLDYYLNVKIPDSILKTKIVGIWSEDPKMEALFAMVKQG